jgi:Zn-dependent M28 family amino/carboxypeptidase
MVAHIDSKWQPVSMTMRVIGVIVMSIGLIGVILAMLLHWPFSGIALGITWLGALPVMASVVGERSDGTLDNASGVATVLEAAAFLPRDSKVGVMITDAEELALAGARAWARVAPRGIALNVDCVDDVGGLVVMYTGSAPGEVISRLEQAAQDRQEPIRVLRLIPGILTDSVALAGAGWRTVTLSRGTIRTLARIHTSRDSLAAMDGRGIEGAARVLAQAADELARGVMK